MSLTLLQTAALLPAELLINRLLSMDSKSPVRLQELEGHTLAIYASKPAFNLYITGRNNKLALSPVFEGIPDASLQGTASNLLQVMLQQTPVTNLAPFHVELQGSTSYVQQLQRLLKELDIDWEFHLSLLFGDLPVAGASKVVQDSSAFIKNTASSVGSNLREYLLYESNLVPAPAATERFYADISAMHVRLDRLQLKIDMIEQA